MPDDISKPLSPKVAPGTPAASNAAGVMTVFVMLVATLYFGKEVLVPVTLALMLAFILAPLVSLLQRLHLGRVPSVLLGVIAALGVVLALGGVIGTQVAELTTDLPRYAATVETKVDTLKKYTVGRLTQLADKVGAPNAVAPATSPPQTGQSAPTGGSAPASPQPASSPIELAYHYLTPILSPLATLGIVFVVAIFALLQREDLRDRMIRLVGSGDLHRTTLAIDDGGRRLSRYFVTQLCINTSFGAVVGAGLFFIGVPNPVLWGIMSALLRFVPYVGSFIAAVLPLGLAAAVEPGWGMVISTAALYVVAEGVTGQIVEPMVYGHSTGLSPFSVIVAAIFWSWVWGPVGLILSTPLTLCLVVIGRHVKRLEFLDVLLGDQPALTPVESFYQRVLAGDADETEEHAEILLKECSLSTYYDEVAVKGLQMAAEDARRGTLDEEKLEKVKSTVNALVQSLAGHDDTQPPEPKAKDEESVAGSSDVEKEPHHNPDPASVPEGHLPASWRDPSKVLCIAGRGPLDEAAAAMLSQLIGKHGMGGRVVGYDEVSRDGIEDFDPAGASMACISYLDLSGGPAHLRYLVQRLRRRLPPGTPLLVGVWPAGDTALSDQQVQRSIGADYFAGSLGESVTLCVEVARKAEERETMKSAA